MATPSITAAVKAKFDALTASNFPGAARPPLFFGQAPQTDGTGAQQRLPYVEFSEQGRQVQVLDFERNSVLVLTLALDVYANTLADVDATVDAIRWNGGAVGGGAGFDFGTLADLTAPRSTHQLLPAGEPRRYEPPLDIAGARVHAARMEYRVTVLERS